MSICPLMYFINFLNWCISFFTVKDVLLKIIDELPQNLLLSKYKFNKKNTKEFSPVHFWLNYSWHKK